MSDVKRGNKKAVTFGEVLLRLSTPSFARFTQASHFIVNYAGTEANVAVSLRHFGISATHVTRVPDNDLGSSVIHELNRHGVNTQHVVIGEGRLGLYFLENGAMQRASRIIYDRFDSAFSQIQQGEVDWEDILKDASWFHYTGITAAISQGAADVCLEGIQAARKLGVKVSGDINYRRNLWQYGKTPLDIMPDMIALTDVVVAGSTDIENCCGITGKSYEDACEKMQKQYPSVKRIASTYRDSISSSHNKIYGVMWTGRTLLKTRQYDLTHIVDRIGAGDAFMAGLIYGLLSYTDDQQALEFATAAGAWKHGIEGDVNLATVSEIETLVKGENVGKLLR